MPCLIFAGPSGGQGRTVAVEPIVRHQLQQGCRGQTVFRRLFALLCGGAERGAVALRFLPGGNLTRRG